MLLSLSTYCMELSFFNFLKSFSKFLVFTQCKALSHFGHYWICIGALFPHRCFCLIIPLAAYEEFDGLGDRGDKFCRLESGVHVCSQYSNGFVGMIGASISGLLEWHQAGCLKKWQWRWWMWISSHGDIVGYEHLLGCIAGVPVQMGKRVGLIGSQLDLKVEHAKVEVKPYFFRF